MDRQNRYWQSRVVRRSAAGGSEAGSEGSVSQDSAAGSAQPETDALRRDVLTGHLLALTAEDGLPRHALPAIATSLQVRGAHAHMTLSHQAAGRWWCCAAAATGWLTRLSSTRK